MANMHLVTGHAGTAHVTAADQGSFNAAMFGSGQYVLNWGNKLSATVVTNNKITISDGALLMQGRYVKSTSSIDLTIENGTQNMLRNDLIVARYTKNISSDVEEVNLIALKGTNAEANPADPDYISGDLLTGNVLKNDMPLYRIPINGINVQTPVPLFKIKSEIEDIPDWAKSETKPKYTASEVGAEASGAVSAHNSSSEAHSALFGKKKDKPTTVNGSGAISITLEDNKDYTYTAVTSLTFTAGSGESHGFVIFGSSAPIVTMTGFTKVSGDITSAAASSVWEFSAIDGYIIWKDWSAV